MTRQDSEQDDLLYALQRLVGFGNSSETLLPLRINGSNTHAPLATGLRVIRKTVVTSGTEVTLSWIDAESFRDHVSRYSVYMLTDTAGKTTPTVVASPVRSPVTVLVQPTSQKVTFLVQTVLKNGQVSQFDLSPTTSIQI